MGKVGFHQWGVVHGHLHYVQDVGPVPVLVLGDSGKLLDCSIQSLGLTVGLWLERTLWSESDVQARAQLFLKYGLQPGVSVGDDGSWQPVVLHDVLDELVCGVDGRGFLPCRNKVCHIGSFVSHREYAVVNAPISSDPEQLYDSIHLYFLSFMYW